MAAGVGVALVASACTGDDDASPTTLIQVAVTTAPPTGPTTSVEAPDLTATYFDAIADGRPAPDTVAVPGSDADAYARFRSVAAQLLGADAAAADPEAGSDGAVGSSVTTSPTATTLPDAIEVCDPDCTTYSLVAVEPSTGRLETFAIDGVPLGGRVVGDGLRADDDGVIASVDTAFRNREGDVLVVVEVRNTTDVDVEVFGFSAVFQASGDASSREASGWWGPESFPAGIGGSVLLAFDAPDGPSDRMGPFGSDRVSLSGLRSDGVAVTFDLTLPRAGG